MGIVGFVLLGLLAGYLGHLVLPRRRAMGAARTMAVATLGSVIGGLVGAFATGEGLQLGTAGLIGAVVGVLVALLVAARAGRSGDGAARRA